MPIIDPALEGPPGACQGGYACGLLAGHLHADAEVTLRKPVPLGTDLRVAPSGDGMALYAGDELVADGVSTRLADETPEPPTFAEALAATADFPGLRSHPYPNCVGCGTARSDPAALRIFPGPVLGGDLLAAVWYPGKPVTTDDAWAALDCPGGWAAMHLGKTDKPAVLGRMAARVSLPAEPENAYIVVGWLDEVSGRKLTAGSALYSREGTLHGFSRQTWITLR
ncbi:hypothetical protein ODJ79_29220 [Actinoplanes sp. KI2]|uniref:hypothetical protein n=1 Tax=Actinoplanes sp. KI2 TaxID=2983315 RepID=UPI0021D5AB3F|nr:hypothetical protein [Actinoplanes sp. KI2]MCU7727817.1 hypothetical protein [Actinoplanes sp. KI2]